MVRIASVPRLAMTVGRGFGRELRPTGEPPRRYAPPLPGGELLTVTHVQPSSLIFDI
ncbi:MAG: hypothetical protein LBM98_11320 [Oscillospiraceae bacterium]|nr:hypothetical protein [Oscillospiraceae bacterium]